MDSYRDREVPEEVKESAVAHKVFIPNEDETGYGSLDSAPPELLAKYRHRAVPYYQRKWNVYAVYENGKEEGAACHMMISSRYPVDYYWELTKCGHHNRIRSSLPPEVWAHASKCYLVHSCSEIGRKPAEKYRKWARKLCRPY